MTKYCVNISPGTMIFIENTSILANNQLFCLLFEWRNYRKNSSSSNGALSSPMHQAASILSWINVNIPVIWMGRG